MKKGVIAIFMLVFLILIAGFVAAEECTCNDLVHSNIWVDYHGVINNRYEVVSISVYNKSRSIAIGQLNISLGTAQGLDNLSSPLITYCLDPQSSVSFGGGDQFQALVSPLTNVVTIENPGSIAYLFNHYGGNESSSVEASALSLALYELRFDMFPNLSSGIFRVNNPILPWTNATEYANMLTQAEAFIAESIGKNEQAFYLDATLNNTQLSIVGRQSFIINCQYNCTEHYCGDGIVNKIEECDDGNQINLDGCTNTCCIDSDHDGVCDDKDPCPNTPIGAEVDKDGCDKYQFCAQFTSLYQCYQADFKDNENSLYPCDCYIRYVQDGLSQVPRCVPNKPESEKCSN